jgi:hypothetical protein
MAGPDGHAPVGAAAAFLAAAIVAGLALWRAPRSPAGFALRLSATFLVFLPEQASLLQLLLLRHRRIVHRGRRLRHRSRRTVTAGAEAAP